MFPAQKVGAVFYLRAVGVRDELDQHRAAVAAQFRDGLDLKVGLGLAERLSPGGQDRRLRAKR